MPDTSIRFSSPVSQRTRKVIGAAFGVTAVMRGKTFLGVVKPAHSTRSASANLIL
jgi:hypothetical protein